MSLGIAFKGPEGIVLAADSRVTLTARIPGQSETFHASYDNATKLLHVKSQPYVGAVTYGVGAIGQGQPRTAHSFLPEFEEEIKDKERMTVEEFASELSDFFMKQWAKEMPKDWTDGDMIFLVGGYDAGQPYGRAFEIHIPGNPVAAEWHGGTSFGIVWGGQQELTERLINGFDQSLPGLVQQHLSLDDAARDQLAAHLKQQLSLRIPYQFLPLQDCVDLSIFLIRTTIAAQSWLVGVRGVGGFIDVATITRTAGFKAIQEKEIRGEIGR